MNFSYTKNPESVCFFFIYKKSKSNQKKQKKTTKIWQLGGEGVGGVGPG